MKRTFRMLSAEREVRLGARQDGIGDPVLLLNADARRPARLVNGPAHGAEVLLEPSMLLAVFNVAEELPAENCLERVRAAYQRIGPPAKDSAPGRRDAFAFYGFVGWR